MTDRELLERAAKAAGLEPLPTGVVWDDDSAEMVPWNPLTDDGDALRLAVKLNMTLTLGEDSMAKAYALGAIQGHAADYGHDGDDDPYAATRRAIVRAAAELCGPSQV